MWVHGYEHILDLLHPNSKYETGEEPSYGYQDGECDLQPGQSGTFKLSDPEERRWQDGIHTELSSSNGKET